VLFASDVFAAEPEKKLAGPSAEGLVSMIMALFLVILTIVAIAWFAKKFNLTPTSSSHFKMVSSISLGGRERIVIIEIQGQQHAIGVTNQSVNHLFELPDKIEPNHPNMADNQLVNKINKLFGYKPPGSKPEE
jgi:flagellar protein FliO/FliZ